MATTGILRLRRSAAQLHALGSVEREIRANDPSYGCKYIRNFRDAFQSYSRVLTAAEVHEQIARAGIVLVGDYHALPNSQRYLASLLRHPALAHRPLVLGLEPIFARDQHILDEWQRREIDERELRQRIRYDLEWGYDWEPLAELLCAARDRGARIYGLDCMPREDLRKIGARDRHAAAKIAEIRQRHPKALILVLFGESHLAPQHLPARITSSLRESDSVPGRRRMLTVLQNVDALYWRAAGEASDHVDAVEVSQRVVCVFNSTPLEKYENYRLRLNRWKCADATGPDHTPTFYNLIDGLVRFLGIDQYSPHNSSQPRLLVDLMPEVYSRSSDALLRRLLQRKGITATSRRSLLRRVRERGSGYLAELNAIYVRQFRMISASEDASRFLHHACLGLPNRCLPKRYLPNRVSPDPQGLEPVDVFYRTVVEHALAFFGSRILHPARPAFRDSDLADRYELTSEDLELQTGLPFADALAVLDLVTALRQRDARDRRPHVPRKRTSPLSLLSQALAWTGRKYDLLTEQLGFLAGNDLYDAYVQGHASARTLRKLFLAHIDQPGIARDAYFQLVARSH